MPRPTLAELERLDNEDCARRRHDARMAAVAEKLEAVGIDPDELIAFLDDRRGRTAY